MRQFFLCLVLLAVQGGMAAVALAQTRPTQVRSVLVCGDSKVHLVDLAKSEGHSPHILWTWDAHEIGDLPEVFRKRHFNSVDDVKPAREGRQLLISSSGGAVTLWDVEKNKTLFFALVPNAHSIELLPGNLLAAAASVHAKGNQVMLFNLGDGKSDGGSTPVFTDALHSAHGLVWHSGRETLFALGFDVLREYRLEGKTLQRVHEWKIPGEGGHELTLAPGGQAFFVTEHTGAWKFDLRTESFSKIEGFPDAENVKSLSQTADGQFLYTVPEEQWWTSKVSLSAPLRTLEFPGMKVYKARWYHE